MTEPDDLTPQPTIVVPDTTFWGRHYGVTVFRSWDLRRNIWWQEVSGERQATYHYGRKILEERGWTFTIPNTTNTIDGYFTQLKKKVGAHQGLRRDRRYKVICELLRKG